MGYHMKIITKSGQVVLSPMIMPDNPQHLPSDKAIPNSIHNIGKSMLKHKLIASYELLTL